MVVRFLALASVLSVLASCSSAERPTNLPPPEYEKPRPLPQQATTPSAATSEPENDPPAPPAKACTKIGCTSSLALEFDGVSNKKGKYTIALQAGDANATCEVTLPLPMCQAGSAETELFKQCQGSLPVAIDQSGDPCKAPAKDQKLLPLRVGAAPDKVEVVVTRDKKEVAKTSLAPTYDKLQPNGPDCEPTCKVASAKVTLK